MHARVHIFLAMAVGRGGGQLYTQLFFPLGKAPLLILQEKEWTRGPVLTQRTEAKFLRRTPGPVLTQRTEAKFLPRIKPRPCSPQLSALPFELTNPPDEASTIGSSSEYSAKGQVFHCERRNQGCSSVRRQVFHCTFRNQCCSFTRDKQVLLLSAPHSLFSI